MTAYVTLKLMERYGIEESTIVTISPEATHVHGTSAELSEGDNLSI